MEGRLFNLLQSFVESDYHLERVRVLLSEGIDPNQQDEFGNTPLHTAAESIWINIEIVRELISAGANVNLVNKTGYRPLHYAAIRRKREMMEALLHAGADINAGTHSGNTALHFAINNRGYGYFRPTGFQRYRIPRIPDLVAIRMLLQHENINVNAVGENNETPLLWAVIYREQIIVKALLSRGANPNISNTYGQSPLHAALNVQIPCHYIVHLLLRHGADLCSLNSENQTQIDILIDRIRDDQSLSFAKLFVKIAVFHCNMSENAKRNLEKNADLSFLQSVCSTEVNMMKTQIVSEKLTIHDILLHCFNEDQFENMILEIYKPLVDILMTGIYTAYLNFILIRIKKLYLWEVLILNLTLKNDAEDFRHVSNLEFLRMCRNCDLFDYISHWELFKLILSHSNLTDSQIRSINPLED
ncbi:unnamed protein product [Larinioides sclopetarius]|uniref:Ankyrin repeat protein n=1 Tax=Larinioides sclopetarius TaxID=280406 RepID=A0AAV2A842_9ARAC